MLGGACRCARMLACVYPPENFEAKTVTVKLHHGKSKRKSKSLLSVKEKLLDSTQTECSNGNRVSNEVRFYSTHFAILPFVLSTWKDLYMVSQNHLSRYPSRFRFFGYLGIDFFVNRDANIFTILPSNWRLRVQDLRVN